ncbi:MAG: alpha-amylase, partial [Thermoproteus sp.]|nr:alpha-amylase [Thermoproteus sp.]
HGAVHGVAPEVGVAPDLGYIRGLGFDAVYLTPIFKAMSYHRYDVVDYEAVDEDLGGAEAFKRLMEEAGRLGVRVILDLPIHHTGSSHPAFQRALGGDPEYARLYYIGGNGYETFESVKRMPKLRYPEALEWVKGLAARWSLEGVYDFRVDVGAGIAPAHLWELREFLGRPLIAEIWGDPYLWRNAVDGAMNYQVWGRLVEFLRGEADGEELAEVLRRQLALLPKSFLGSSWLFLGTHDTPRAATLLGDRGLVEAGLAFIYTWLGTPMVYYGDEVGMEGGGDPDNRRCMDWSRDDGGLRDLIRRLSALRPRAPKSIKAGRHHVEYSDGAMKVSIANKPMFGSAYYKVEL